MSELTAEELERAQEAKRRDTVMAERFMKRYEGRYIRTPFFNNDHVGELALRVQCYAGDYGSDWFKYTPCGMSTHDIMEHNSTCDPALKLNQYVIFGFAKHVSQESIEELENEFTILALSF